MALIASLGLLLGLVMPLFRDGHPPCLTAGQTVRWLIHRPAAARCADCHSRPLASTARSFLTTPPSWLAAHTHPGSPTSSCITCHQGPPRS